MEEPMPRHLKTAALAGTQDEADAKTRATVEGIIADVRARGDQAVRELSERFDKWSPKSFRLSAGEIRDLVAQVSPQTIDDIKFAQQQIRNFAEIQRASLKDVEVETLPGVVLGHRHIPVGRVGCYVPGGRYPMVASAHMSIVTAKVAGVAHITACTPPNQGGPHPETIAAMHLGGADEICVLGGVQAVAAMGVGTETFSPVDMLVGPGNAYVAEAKRQVFGRVGIDSIAGPSEVVILADADNDARRVAVDLLAQAEHDEAAQAILITTSDKFADAVAMAVAAEIPTLPRAKIAGASWRDHGAVIVVRDWDEAVALVDRIAPEHLQIMTPDPAAIFARVRHAGAVFLGAWCPEAVGDYVAGPNHVLPTGRSARFASGLSVFDFLKRTTWVAADRAALGRVGPAAVALAEAEGLQAHASSIALRLGQGGGRSGTA
jgi:histidinol dehydrogenase